MAYTAYKQTEPSTASVECMSYVNESLTFARTKYKTPQVLSMFKYSTRGR